MSGCKCSSSHGEDSCGWRSLAVGDGARPSDEYTSMMTLISFGAEGVLRLLREVAVMDRGSRMLIDLVGNGPWSRVALRRGLLVYIVERYIQEGEAHELQADLCIDHDCLSPSRCAAMIATITTSAIAHQIAHLATYIRPFKKTSDDSQRHCLLRRNLSMFTPIR